MSGAGLLVPGEAVPDGGGAVGEAKARPEGRGAVVGGNRRRRDGRGGRV